MAAIMLPIAVVGLILGAIDGGFGWWGFGGCVGLCVASIFGMVGGFGRVRWPLILYFMLAWTGCGFCLASSSLYWQQTNLGGGLTGVQIAASVFMFIAAVIAFISGITALAAAVARRRDAGYASAGPAWVVEEQAKANVIRSNRAVVAFSILAMVCAIPTLIMAAVEGSYSSWWAFGGAIGITVAAIFGIIAGFRARRGLHIIHAILMFTAVAFTLVGVGAFFHGARTLFYGPLSPLQQAVAALGFIASVFGFIGALISSIVVFMYRRRALPTTAGAYPATVAAPTVVVGKSVPMPSPVWLNLLGKLLVFRPALTQLLLQSRPGTPPQQAPPRYWLRAYRSRPASKQASRSRLNNKNYSHNKSTNTSKRRTGRHGAARL